MSRSSWKTPVINLKMLKAVKHYKTNMLIFYNSHLSIIIDLFQTEDLNLLNCKTKNEIKKSNSITVSIYNGKKFEVKILEGYSLGHKFGEVRSTRKINRNRIIKTV